MERVVPGMPALRAGVASLTGLGALLLLAAAAGYGTAPRGGEPVGPAHFLTADRCMPCHNSLTTRTGQDASIGIDWRGSVMANSSRDPYWQASVRRETLDHPSRKDDIEDECSTCHMPMQRYAAHAAGGRGEVLARLPSKRGTDPLDSLAADGVSCTLCHQIQPANLSDSSGFNGGFVIDTATPRDRRPIFGPYVVNRGHATVMHSSSGFVPMQADQIRQSELCGTCHTLFTPGFDSSGKQVGAVAEQAPFLEWRHSAYYREAQGCESCHMDRVVAPGDSVPITAVLGDPRPDVRRHWFPGGNFFILGILNRYRAELAVEALPQELDAVAARTRELLGRAARLALRTGPPEPGRVVVDVGITNLNGHKLPTAFPSRRAWLHVVVRDHAGAIVFESGALMPSGRIVGNDNDDDRTKFEPHYREITRPDQVEIYETIIKDTKGMVTTGLTSGVAYFKDNRILPRGFDKATAGPGIAVVGDAADDPAFVDGADRVRYRVDVARAQGPFTVEAELWYQPIGFRWAHNLRLRPAPETDRFVAYYESMADASAIVLARDSLTLR